MNQNVYKVSITLEVTATSKEEAVQHFVEDIQELGVKHLDPLVEETNEIS